MIGSIRRAACSARCGKRAISAPEPPRARLVGVDWPERFLQKTPIDRPRQLHQRMSYIDDLVKPWAEQILLTGLPSLAWSHRKSPLHQLEREESRLAIRRNSQNRICKEVAPQRPKTGKFDYLSAPNHPAHSMAFKFFTDDFCACQGLRRRGAGSCLAMTTLTISPSVGRKTSAPRTCLTPLNTYSADLRIPSGPS